MIQLSGIATENVDLTVYYGADAAFDDSAKKRKLEVENSSAFYSFESDEPIFLVAQFTAGSKIEGTGFSLSFAKSSVKTELDIAASAAAAGSLSEPTRAEAALEEIKNATDLPVAVLAFISVFVLLVLVAITAACLGAMKTRTTLNSNKIALDLAHSLGRAERKGKRDDALERAKQIVIEVEQHTEPYAGDAESGDNSS